MNGDQPTYARDLMVGEDGFCSQYAYYTSTGYQIDALDMETRFFVYPDALIFKVPMGDATLRIERRSHGSVVEPPVSPTDRPSSHFEPCLPITNARTWMQSFRAVTLSAWRPVL